MPEQQGAMVACFQQGSGPIRLHIWRLHSLKHVNSPSSLRGSLSRTQFLTVYYIHHPLGSDAAEVYGINLIRGLVDVLYEED